MGIFGGHHKKSQIDDGFVVRAVVIQVRQLEKGVVVVATYCVVLFALVQI